LNPFEKALLGKGKPLNKISLNNKDIPVLKKLLCQLRLLSGGCGKSFKGTVTE